MFQSGADLMFNINTASLVSAAKKKKKTNKSNTVLSTQTFPFLFSLKKNLPAQFKIYLLPLHTA